MRYSRWLILAAFFAIVGFVAITYSDLKKARAKDIPVPPASLEAGVEGRGLDWTYGHTDGNCPRVRVRAGKYRQIENPQMMELEQLELQLYQPNCVEFDLVKSDKAKFDIPAKSLYSEGAVEITMGVQAEGPPHGRLLKIHTAGVHFSSDSGVATTDAPATFDFDKGSGSATGADYDPRTRDLHLHSQVSLDWRGKTASAIPMHAEAGEAIYKERESRVDLFPWSKLTRGTLHLDAGTSVVLLEKGDLKNAQVQSATGVQSDPERKVEFGADRLDLNFGEANVIREIEGDHNTRLISTTSAGRTTVSSDHLNLNFIVSGEESTLDTGTASGHSVAESIPAVKPGTTKPGASAPETKQSPTRILRSDTIRLKMRDGGREIESAETGGAGSIELLPNNPAQPKRTLQGDRIWIAYGAENRIQSFRSTNVSTRTDKAPVPGQPVPAPAFTQSKDILATFDPDTGDLARVEQKNDFHYQEGARQARGNVAILEQQSDVMTLDGAARAWDDTGSVNADHISMNQKTGDYTAEGHVASTRQPDKKNTSSGMLSNQEVIQAQAQKMVSTDRNQKVDYEGNAVAWQGANRVKADRLVLDNQHHLMEAHGHVVSEFVDKSKAGDGKASTKSIFTNVKAEDLVYTDETRMALYTGGTSLVRPGLTLNSRELRAYLKSGNSDSSLDKAFADGAVKVVNTTAKPGQPLRTRTGTGEHGEYYTEEGKVVLQGMDAVMVDSLKGNTKGSKLTWWENNDTLLVNGSESKPAESTIRKNAIHK